MPKVKRGGTNPIDKPEELHDDDLMRFWIRRGTRGSKRSPFVFKKRCKFLEDNALLIVGPAGKKIKSSLVRATRVGSKTIRGWMYKEGNELIIETKDVKSKSDQEKTARYIYSTLTKYTVRVPLSNIIIRNPMEKEEEEIPQKPSSKTPKKTTNIEKSTSEESSTSSSEESLIDNSLSEEENSSEEKPNVEEIKSDLRVLDSRKKELLSKTAQRELQLNAYYNKFYAQEKEEQKAQDQEDQLRKTLLKASDSDTLNALVQNSHLSDSIKKRIRKESSTDRLDAVLEDLSFLRKERENKRAQTQEELLIKDKSLDKRHIDALEIEQEHVEKKEELSKILMEQKTAEGKNALQEIIHNMDSTELLVIWKRYDFTSAWNELQSLISEIQNHPKHSPLQMGDGDDLTQREAFYQKIEEEYDTILKHLDDKTQEWSHQLEKLAIEIDALPQEQHKDGLQKIRSLTAVLHQASSAMHKAFHKQQEYGQRAQLLQEVGDVTADLIGDRRQQNPSAPIHHTDPLDDLRLVNPRIHGKLKAVIQNTPSLRIMICHLIYRIQDIQHALDEKKAEGVNIQMASDNDVDGPLTPLWEQVPSSSDPNRFVVQYQKWCTLENRMWYLLKNPLETRTR